MSIEVVGLKWDIAQKLAPYPSLFYPLARLFGRKEVRSYLVSSENELVISGYPRSANTFAVFAFLQAQGRSVSIARHLHAEAEVIEALRLGIPTVVLVRHPEAAIRSYKAAVPGLDENKALTRWIQYYSRVESLCDQIVISDFPRTIHDFGSVIDELNLRFGTTFIRFDSSEDNCNRVFRAIEPDENLNNSEELYFIPNEERNARLKEQKLNFDADLFMQAEELYRRYQEVGKAPVIHTTA